IWSLRRTRSRRRIMVAASSAAPTGADNSDASVHGSASAAFDIVRPSGLAHRPDSMRTTIDGGCAEVLAVIQDATEAGGGSGTPACLVVKADIRPGYTGEIDGKIERLEKAIDSRSES